MKDFLKKYKTYLIVIVILVVYLVVFRIVSVAINDENDKYAKLIVDGVNIWEYKQGNWNVLTEDELGDEGTVYGLYSSGQYYGDYTVKVNDRKLYAFDAKYNSLQYNDSILAINSNYSIDVYFFGYSDISQEDNDILDIVVNNGYGSKIKKISLDVDKDEKDEYFYIINYYDNGEIIFTNIYYYDNKLREIINGESSKYIIYDISYILDIDNDAKFEIIVSGNYFNSFSYKMYKLHGKRFDLYLE